MNKRVENSILKTLCYSDIFDYPLTKNEIWKFLLGEINKKSFEKELEQLQEEAKIIFARKFYCLFSRQKIVAARLRKQKASRAKINIAQQIVKFFNFIPVIKFVGISGALSLENSEKDDDIDLFVITSKGQLWLVRLILIIFLKVIGRYRSYNSKKFSDKICLNMLVAEEALAFPKERQNLYTAHEIAQMLPILNKNNVYETFLETNRWVKNFLPNALERIKDRKLRIKNKNSFFTFHFSFFILEQLAKHIQLLSINKRKTTEIISDNFLAFHPFDYKEKILKEYEKRLKQYGI